MAASTMLILFLSINLYVLTSVQGQDNIFEDPDPNDDNVLVTNNGVRTLIHLKENSGDDVKIGLLVMDPGEEDPTIEFTEGSNTLGLKFVKENDDWFLVVGKNQDYELEDNRQYKFMAYIDKTLKTVELYIDNIDDMTPYFNLPPSSECRVEETFIGITNCLLFVNDGDGLLDVIEFAVNDEIVEIVKVDSKECATNNNNDENMCLDVYLKKNVAVDYLDKPVISLDLQVKDSQGHSNLSYVMQLSAVNKNSPKISPSANEITIPEHFSGFIHDLTFTVEDNDMGNMGQFDITIECESCSTVDWSTAFSVVPNFGYLKQEIQISVIDPEIVDFEKEEWRRIELKIIATERYNKENVGYASLVILLENVNDIYPTFVEEYKFEVEENSPFGTTINTIKANDDDYDDKITYRLASDILMAIDPTTGVISVNTDNLNYERQSEVTLTAIATDLANHSAYTQVTIIITDVNDEIPEIYMPTGQHTVSELEGESYEILTFTVHDPDEKADISLQINWSDSVVTNGGVIVSNQTIYEGCMTIDYKEDDERVGTWNAQLLLVKELNWGDFNYLQLVIEAEDHGTHDSYPNSRFSNATVTVTIIDENNHKPEFEADEITISVKELTPEGYPLGAVIASDADGPNNNKVRYSLGQSSDGKEYLTIDTETGEIKAGKHQFDYEDNKEIIYTVFAVDNDPEHKTELKLIIEVEDTNDEMPCFGNSESIYDEEFCTGNYTEKNYEILELPTEKITIEKFQAFDKDGTYPFNEIWFTIDKRYSSIFAIDIKTGELYVKEESGQNLDISQQKSYSIQVTINDNCDENDVCLDETSNSKSITITVDLIDINNNDPEFAQQKPITIKEDHNLGGWFGRVIAEDGDENGINSDLTYDIISITSDLYEDVDPSLFNIDPDLGDLETGLYLTDKWGTYNVEIMAIDHGDPPRNGSTTISVIVEDINNHEPVFEFPEKDEVIKLNLTGLELHEPLKDNAGNELKIVVTDEYDDGDFGTDGIQLSIIGDDIAEHYFYLNEENKLMLKDHFSETMQRKFTLSLYAMDNNGVDGMHSERNASIRLRVNNEEEPYFVMNEWDVNFKEGPESVNIETEIKAGIIDRNNDDCIEEGEPGEDCMDAFYFFIIDGNEDAKFEVISPDNTIPYLKVIEELDRETVSEYALTVLVTNNEKGEINGEERSQLKITVIVEDIKDEPPTFEEHLFVKGINIGDKNEDIVTKLVAIDEDDNDVFKFEIVGDITATHESLYPYLDKPFNLEEDTGILRLGFALQDSSLKGAFKFNVNVTDTAHMQDTASVQIYVISESNLLPMLLKNDAEEVRNKQSKIEAILTSVLQYKGNIKQVTQGTDSNGVPIDKKADVQAYFMDAESQQPVEKSVITEKLLNKEIFNELYERLLEEQLVLEKIDDSAEPEVANMEGVLQTVLIVVSVVLGTLVVVLFAAFFIRTRSLNRRLEALSTTKFGSQDSGLNRIGMSVPNTNRHAVEGSNPVWGNEDVSKNDFDNISLSSGDSDLIGVEENPEFHQHSKSGINNGGFTPDIEIGRRDSVNPLAISAFEGRTNLNPFTATMLTDNTEVMARRDSVNPLANSSSKFDDYDTISNGFEESPQHNSNFSLVQRSDKRPTTEL